MMRKARSRLRLDNNLALTERAKSLETGLHFVNLEKNRHKNTTKNNIWKQVIVTRRLKLLPHLILGLGFSSLVYYLMHNFYPDQIRDIILPDFYLPLLITLMASAYLLLVFILARRQLSFVIAFCLTCLVFLKLQKVVLDVKTVIVVLLFFAIIGLSLTYLLKLFFKVHDANFKSKSRQASPKKA